jgi:bifunctional DNase/RNase
MRFIIWMLGFTVFTVIGMIFCFSGVFIAQLELKKKSRKKNIDSLPGGAIIHEY